MKFLTVSKSVFLILILFLVSCKSQDKKKLTDKNIKIEKIMRLKNEKFSIENIPSLQKLKPYPFEDYLDNIPKITKEYFRCKGNPLNPERIDESDPENVKVYLDCDGSSKHSLPLIHNNKEGVYPVLIDILNYIQKKVKKQVIITCGHRCFKHNSYSDFDNNAKYSKHMIGAEVDFYVESYEQNPKEIINIIFEYYKESKKYKNKDSYLNFYEDNNSKNLSFHNKEILINLYDFNEGRDFSNRHPYPYISIQVLYDIDTKENVTYSWEKANRKILHY